MTRKDLKVVTLDGITNSVADNVMFGLLIEDLDTTGLRSSFFISSSTLGVAVA